MSTILKKVLDLFRSSMPNQPAMAKMKGMEQMTEMERRERKSNDMAALSGDMEMVHMQPVKRQGDMDKDMQTAMDEPGMMMEEAMDTPGRMTEASMGEPGSMMEGAMDEPGSMMEEPKPSEDNSGMATLDQSMDDES